MRAVIAGRPLNLTRSAAGSGSAAAASLAAAAKHGRSDNQRDQAAREDASEGGSGDYEDDEKERVAEMARGAEHTHADGGAAHGRVGLSRLHLCHQALRSGRVREMSSLFSSPCAVFLGRVAWQPEF